jgi:threonine aldolase
VSETVDRIRTLVRQCDSGVFWHRPTTPEQDFAELAQACRTWEIEAHDAYGDGGPVERLEHEVAELFGKPAAVFFPSGVMAQQSVLRVWCERSASFRVAIPDLSHLLMHEDDGPRLLHWFRFEHLTVGPHVATAEDVTRLGAGLGAVMVELPLREAGYLLPTWDQLTELSGTTRAAGVPLHADGARIWESQPYFGRSLAEIAELVDSMYVSFYKGLGGMAGACVVGPDDVMAAVRVWRRRMGGTLFHLSPYAISALVGLREGLPRMASYVDWAQQLGAALVEQGFRVQPSPPHTNSFQVHLDGDAEQLNRVLLDHLERSHDALWPDWRASTTPGWSWTELVVHAQALGRDPAEVARAAAELFLRSSDGG